MVRSIWTAFAAGIAAASLALPTLASTSRGVPELTPSQWERVNSLIDQMTVEEKAGQMVQLTLGSMTSEGASAENPRVVIDEAKARDAIVKHGIGSILNAAWVTMPPEAWRDALTQVQALAAESRLGIPLIYGVDSVHGANYITGATLFPHNLTLAATWRPEFARQAGEVTAAETRAVGLTWNFAPVCDVMRTPVWSRVFETFGEDPLACGIMAAAAIEGMQGDDLASDTSLAATGKHFLGYSDPRSGRDRTPAIISTPELFDTYIPPFERAFDSGVRTIMVNSGEINGVPVHADPMILTVLLRDQMDYQGVVVTDWEDVLKLIKMHAVAEDERQATRLAVDAGIDMAMTPDTVSFAEHLIELVRAGEVSESRLDESVRRILALKMELGLFDRTMPEQPSAIGTPEAHEKSLNTAREGVVLLRNHEGLLPLDAGSTILVTGPAADSLPALHGSWTYSWQGTELDLYPDTPTVLDAMRSRFGADRVLYETGSEFNEPKDIAAAVAAAQRADVVVLCVGEWPSVEKPGDISDLSLSWPQTDLALQLVATGKPVVLVVITNRPRILAPFEGSIPAILWAGHPGPHGSTALAEILAGDVNPSGKLPFTYPRHPNALLMYDHKYSEHFGPNDGEEDGYDPLFPFGSGMSYTSFEYSDLQVESPDEITPGGRPVVVSVTVRNTGVRAGSEAVLLFKTDKVASITPRVRRLAAFEKIDLEPGQSRRVAFEIDAHALSMVTRTGARQFEPGEFVFSVQDLSETVRLGSGRPVPMPR